MVFRNQTINLREALVTVIVSLLAFPLFAFASTATGNAKYATVNGYSYKYYATVATSGGNAIGRGWVQTTNGASAPTGYIGIRAYVCKVGTGAVASYGYVYNSSATAGMGIAASTSYESGKTYYANADIHLYNGNSYNYYITYNTPYVQTTSGLGEITADESYSPQPVEMSINGKTDKVLPAEGINGKVGYITYTDLDMYYVSSSPEEAVAYTLSQPDVRYIPVYDKDGVTIIDSYPVYGGYNNDLIEWL